MFVAGVLLFFSLIVFIFVFRVGVLFLLTNGEVGVFIVPTLKSKCFLFQNLIFKINGVIFESQLSFWAVVIEYFLLLWGTTIITLLDISFLMVRVWILLDINFKSLVWFFIFILQASSFMLFVEQLLSFKVMKVWKLCFRALLFLFYLLLGRKKCGTLFTFSLRVGSWIIITPAQPFELIISPVGVPLLSFQLLLSFSIHFASHLWSFFPMRHLASSFVSSSFFFPDSFFLCRIHLLRSRLSDLWYLLFNFFNFWLFNRRRIFDWLSFILTIFMAFSFSMCSKHITRGVYLFVTIEQYQIHSLVVSWSH